MPRVGLARRHLPGIGCLSFPLPLPQQAHISITACGGGLVPKSMAALMPRHPAPKQGGLGVPALIHIGLRTSDPNEVFPLPRGTDVH